MGSRYCASSLGNTTTIRLIGLLAKTVGEAKEAGYVAFQGR